jgi:galactokinase
MIDQYAALLCQAGHAMLLDCGTQRIRQVPFDPARSGMVALVIDTRVPHALVSGEYAARRAECEEAARRLGVPFLGALTAGLSTVPAPERRARVAERAVGQLADPALRRRARHVITDTVRAEVIADLLAAAKPETFRLIGELLTEGHASLRDDFEVSWEAADVTVSTVLAAGALGAKMIGGGFGGSVLALVPADALAGARAAVAAEFAHRAWEAPGFLDAIPSPAARQLA